MVRIAILWLKGREAILADISDDILKNSINNIQKILDSAQEERIT